MLNDLVDRHDERLQFLIDRWMEDMERRCPGELLDDALDIFNILYYFSRAAARPDIEKAASLIARDLKLSAYTDRFTGLEPDDEGMRKTVAAVSAGDFWRGEYRRESLPPDFAGMDAGQLQEKLLEQIGKEYEDYILGVFFEMDKTQAVLHAAYCQELILFYQGINDLIPQADLDRKALEQLLSLERPLDVLYTEYRGCSIDEYLNHIPFSNLEKFIQTVRDPESNMVMEAPF